MEEMFSGPGNLSEGCFQTLSGEVEAARLQEMKRFFGEGREVKSGPLSWEKEQRDPQRKVPRPSVGICLNSWGNPPRTHTHPLLVFFRGQGRECVCVCVLMCVNVCVLGGDGVPHCNGVLGGRVGTERREEGAE